MATVLIVEDDSTIRRGIKKWLELEELRGKCFEFELVIM